MVRSPELWLISIPFSSKCSSISLVQCLGHLDMTFATTSFGLSAFAFLQANFPYVSVRSCYGNWKMPFEILLKNFLQPFVLPFYLSLVSVTVRSAVIHLTYTSLHLHRIRNQNKESSIRLEVLSSSF